MKKIIYTLALVFSMNLAASTMCTDESCDRKPSTQKNSSTKNNPSHSEFVFPINPSLIQDIVHQCNFMQVQIPVVIKVGASWCMPCKKSALPYEQLAKKYTPMVDALFFTLTVDDRPAGPSDAIQYLTKTLNIKIISVPAFIIIHRGEVHVIHGSDKVHDVEKMLKHLHKKYPRATAVTSKNIEQLIYTSKKPVILKLHAAWCPPCSFMEPIFEDVAKEFKNQCTFLRLDTMQDNALATELMKKNDIQGIPLFLFFRNGVVVKKFAGGKTKIDFQKDVKDFLTN
jgi:thioredoxin 1